MDNPIRTLRNDLAINQTAFGRSIGVAQNTVSVWESGSPLTARHALAVVGKWPRRCKRLGITVEKLIRQGRTPQRRPQAEAVA